MIDKRLATLVVGNKIFFFNEEGRYTSVSVNEARKMDFINVQFKHFGAYLEYMPKNKLCAICGIGNYHGNSPVLNLVQEAKNGKGKSKIYVNQENELLREKAETLEGYVEPFEMKDNIAHKIFEENPEILK